MAEIRVQRMRSVIGRVLGALRRVMFVALVIDLLIFHYVQPFPRADTITNPAADSVGLTITIPADRVYPLEVVASGPGEQTTEVLTVAVNEPPAPSPTLSPQDAVIIRRGEKIQAVVNASPEGQAFVLECGIYREQTVKPKNGQSFDGQGCATLSGARVVTGWRRDGAHWRLDGLPAARKGHGGCSGGGTLCRAREDLFVGGVLYRRVGTLAELAPGRMYRDGNTIFITDDPTGQTVELALKAFAFKGKATGVVLKSLTVVHYASDSQWGAINARGGREWRIVGVTSRWNHGGGLGVGPGSRVIGGLYADNGQIGIVGHGKDIVLDGVEIARNNYAGYSGNWEAGGTKFVKTDGLVVRNSCVHDNIGSGLWTDIDNVNTLLEDNVVFRNARSGIQHEISGAAVIRRNVLVDNGNPARGFLWAAGILVQNSSDVEVYENFVQVHPDYGNGITIVSQKRKNWIALDNNVHHNLTVFLGDRVGRPSGGIVGGGSGMASEGLEGFFENNRWEDNEYVVPPIREAKRLFAVNGGWRKWSYVQMNTQLERRGILTLERRQSIEIACP